MKMAVAEPIFVLGAPLRLVLEMTHQSALMLQVTISHVIAWCILSSRLTHASNVLSGMKMHEP